MPARGSFDDERIRRRERMTRSADYLRCYRRGRRRRGRSATLHTHPNEGSSARLGITASRKIGGAVVRHRMKRRVREIFRRWVDRDAVAGLDVVVHLQPGCAQTSFDEFREELVGLFSEVARANARTSSGDRPSDRESSDRRRSGHRGRSGLEERGDRRQARSQRSRRS